MGWTECLSIDLKLQKNLSYIAVVHVSVADQQQIAFVRNPGNGYL